MSKIQTAQQSGHPSIEFSVELMSRKELMEYLNDIRRTLNSLDLKFIMMNLERRLRECEHILGIEPPPPMGHGKEEWELAEGIKKTLPEDLQ